MNKPVRKAAIIFGALSPYHIARARAAAEFCARQGVKLTVIQRVPFQSDYPWFGQNQAAGLEVITASVPKGNHMRTFASALTLVRIIRRLDPEALAFGMGSLAYLGPLAWCSLHRRKALLFSESKTDDEIRSPMKEWFKRRIYGRFRAAIVGGMPHVDYAAAMGIPRRRCFTGYDVVDNGYFAEEAGAACSSEKESRNRHHLPSCYWLAASRFVPKKNLVRLLEAYSIYRSQLEDAAWKLVILGDGPEKELLLQKRTQLGLESDVIMPGLMGYDSLPVFYGLAKAFIHASTVEQWGLVANEAMASGLPILLSQTIGCRSTLLHEGENGYSFDPFDTSSISEAMLRFHRLSREQQEQMGKRSLETIGEWGPDRFAQAFWQALNA